MTDVRPVYPGLHFDFHQIVIQCPTWTQHFYVWSPTLARCLSRYSHAVADFWAMMELFQKDFPPVRSTRASTTLVSIYNLSDQQVYLEKKSGSNSDPLKLIVRKINNYGR